MEQNSILKASRFYLEEEIKELEERLQTRNLTPEKRSFLLASLNHKKEILKKYERGKIQNDKSKKVKK